MFYISSQDLLKLDKFAHLTPLKLIDKKYDKAILDECFTIGLDKEAGYMWDYSLHRPLMSKVPVLDFRLVGEVRKDSDFRKSPAYTIEMQMLSSLRQDVSLTRELCSLSGTSFDYSKMLEEDRERDREDIDSVEESFEDTARTIGIMNELLIAARGTQYNEWGSFKTFEEWKNG